MGRDGDPQSTKRFQGINTAVKQLALILMSSERKMKDIWHDPLENSY
jgi:hypothetical protein